MNPSSSLIVFLSIVIGLTISLGGSLILYIISKVDKDPEIKNSPQAWNSSPSKEVKPFNLNGVNDE